MAYLGIRKPFANVFYFHIDRRCLKRQTSYKLMKIKDIPEALQKNTGEVFSHLRFSGQGYETMIDETRLFHV
jgi:hypothetical protein